MTDSVRTERVVREWLAETAQPHVPDWFDEVLATTARTRQRPAWSFPERWLPVATIGQVVAPARQVPWRVAGLVVLLLLLLVGALALYVGSRSGPPLPYGLASPGLVAYASDGDILTIEPTTGRTRVVVDGPGTDSAPVWSLDGQRLAFVRDGRDIVVAGEDGTELVTIASGLMTPSPVSFSPDGRLVLIQDFKPGEVGTLWLANADGSGARRLSMGRTGVSPDDASFRPPDGRQIIFRGGTPTSHQGIYVVDVDGTNLKTLVEPHPVDGMGAASYSPDGRLITYNRWTPSDRVTSQQHVMTADGTGEVVLPLPEGAFWHSGGRWSNDSTRLLLLRGYGFELEDVTLAVAPADGSTTGVESGPPPPGTYWAGATWAPDDGAVIGALAEDEQVVGHVLWDPSTGEIQDEWPAGSEPSWQRVAP